MKRVSILCCALSALLTAANAYGYSTATHAAMTANAMNQSNLASDPEIFKQLGLTEMLEARFDAPFHDRNGGNDIYIAIRSPSLIRFGNGDFEQGILNQVKTSLGTPTDFSVTGWMMRGAIREDDNSIETPGSDEPGGVFQRVFALSM